MTTLGEAGADDGGCAAVVRGARSPSGDCTRHRAVPPPRPTSSMRPTIAGGTMTMRSGAASGPPGRAARRRATNQPDTIDRRPIRAKSMSRVPAAWDCSLWARPSTRAMGMSAVARLATIKASGPSRAVRHPQRSPALATSAAPRQSAAPAQAIADGGIAQQVGHAPRERRICVAPDPQRQFERPQAAADHQAEASCQQRT